MQQNFMDSASPHRELNRIIDHLEYKFKQEVWKAQYNVVYDKSSKTYVCRGNRKEKVEAKEMAKELAYDRYSYSQTYFKDQPSKGHDTQIIALLNTK